MSKNNFNIIKILIYTITVLSILALMGFVKFRLALWTSGAPDIDSLAMGVRILIITGGIALVISSLLTIYFLVNLYAERYMEVLHRFIWTMVLLFIPILGCLIYGFTFLKKNNNLG